VSVAIQNTKRVVIGALDQIGTAPILAE